MLVKLQMKRSDIMPKEYLRFTIRDQISDWIRDNKSSQAKLAKEIGISEATLNRFMSGKTDTLGIEQIVKLAKIFGCSTDYLLGVTDIPRHQIIDAEELGLTENAATNIISRTVPIDILNELLVDPHFIKALLLIDFYSSDYFAQIVEGQNDFTKSMRDFAGKVNPKAKEVKKAVVLSKPNFKAEQLINIQYEFMAAVKDIKKNSAANADNRANKEFLEKILAAFKSQDVMKLTPEQISATIANVVKSSGNIDENMQKIIRTFGTELLKDLPSDGEKKDEG